MRQSAGPKDHEEGGTAAGQRIPRDTALDSTLALLAEGYRFISTRCDRYGSDIFETRLMLRGVFCMRGEEAARVFYEPDRFTRKGALPFTAVRLLQDYGSVMLMDGEAHRLRKQMFLSLMMSDSMRLLADGMEGEWRNRIGTWQRADKVTLHSEVQELLCRTVCRWAGIPLPEEEVKRRSGEFAAMIDGAGAVGPRNWRAMMRRQSTERWARGIVRNARSGALEAREGSAVRVISFHRDLEGKLLDERVAAVELINVLRPTVAVARFITFAALALHDHPEWRARLQLGEPKDLQAFVQEVRRFYPFFPFIGGRARTAFTWRGRSFAEGTWMLLDVYGTNRDGRIWEDPHSFVPDRFHRWDESPFDYIPQGGGDYRSGHRCPGERVTIELMKRAVVLLTQAMRYDVPEQDLRIDLARMPALPASGFVISNVKPISAQG